MDPREASSPDPATLADVPPRKMMRKRADNARVVATGRQRESATVRAARIQAAATIEAAQIQSRGAVRAAVITVVGAILAALIMIASCQPKPPPAARLETPHMSTDGVPI